MIFITKDNNNFKTLHFFGLKIKLSRKRRRMHQLMNNIKAEIYASLHSDLNLLKNAIADPHGLGFLELLLENAHVPQHHKAIFQKMPANAICIDGGANIGVFTDICCHQKAIVHAFEPALYAYNILKEKYKNNSDVIVYKKAIWTENCEMDFYDCTEEDTDFLTYSQGNSLIKNTLSDGYKHTSKEKVQACDFIEFLNNNFISKNLSLYLIKLDIEGAEFEVLEQIIANNYHKHINKILVETHETSIPDGEEKLQKIKDLITANNITNIYLDWY